jgi:hypothetical protein
MAKITIGTTDYVAKSITQYLAQPLAEAFRTTGTQRRADNLKVNKAIYGWHRGIGNLRIRREAGQGVDGLRDSDALTIHRSGIYPGLLHEAQTHADPAQVPKKFVNFKGDLFCLFEENYNGSAVNRIVCHKWNPDVWDAVGTVETSASGDGMRCFDAIAHEGYMWALVTNDGDDNTASSIVIARSTDGATWEETGTSTQVTFDGPGQNRHRRQNPVGYDDGGRLLSFGNTLLVATWDEADNQINVLYSANPEAVSPTFTAGAVIPSGWGPKALVSWRDPTTAGNPATPILVTAEGIYRVDSGGTTFDLLYTMDGDPNNGRWSVVGTDGALWVPLGSGGYLRYELTGQNSRDINFVQPPDGLMAERQGFAHYTLAPTVPWLISAYGGHAADQKPSIFAISYTPYEDPVTGERRWPWHRMYAEADDNLVLYLLGYSGEDDATPRLHFAIWEAEGTASEMYHLEEPFTDPATGVTQKFQATSFVETGDDDMGDPHADSNVLTGRVDAVDLSSGSPGDQYIEHEYGIDGAVSTTVTNFGNYVLADKVLFFGKTEQNTAGSEAGTPIGVSAKTMRHRWTLKRGSTTTLKVGLRELQVEYRNKLLTLNGWEITLDLADQPSGVTTEAVITALEVVRDSVVNVAFAIGQNATTYVEMIDSSLRVDLDEEGGGDGLQLGSRAGTVTFKLEEVIPDAS